jgi:hypothetical protein
MELTTFVRKPFTVQAVEITEDNIAEIAELIGTLRHYKNKRPYIQINRRLVPNIERVYIGFFLTKFGDDYRCYSRYIFGQQFAEHTPEIQQWIDFMNAPKVVVADG